MTREKAMYLLNNLRSVAEGEEDEAIDMAIEALSNPTGKKGYIRIGDVYRLIAGHSNYHGDSILSAFTCIAEGKEVIKPIRTLDE